MKFPFIPGWIIPKECLPEVELPVATTSKLGGLKLYSNTKPTVADRTYGAMCNDQGGYLRTMPARLGGGLHWAGVVSVYDEFRTDLNYAYTDVFSAGAVKAAYNSLKGELDTILDKLNGEVV